MGTEFVIQKKAIIDLETTGTHLQKDRILEIGLVLMDGNTVEEEWSSFVDPEGVVISSFISQLTGINNTMCREAPRFSELAGTLHDKLKDRVVYAHNARFDYAFLKQAFQRCNYEFSAPYVCTVRLSKLLFPHHKKHNLDAVRERLQLPIEDRHRALGDTRTVLHFIQHLYATQATEDVEKLLHTITSKPALPPLLKESAIAALPTGPGVYIFKNAEKQTLYVGKSICIKKRVQSHFYSTTKDSKELTLFQNIQHIETIETNTEFEALVVESRLVKQLMPVYNRKLRKQQSYCVVSVHKNKDQYLTTSITRNKRVVLADISGTVCLFRTVRAAKQALTQIAEQYQLCQKLLCLEKANTSCFGYHLGQCSGACMQKESTAAYNQRFLESIEPVSLQCWPYTSAILISDSSHEQSRYHMIYKWAYVGSFDSIEQAVSEPIQAKEIDFDLDQYMIIRSFLHKETAQVIRI